MAKAKWIQGVTAHMKKGALHKELGVKAGKKIPEKKLEKAEHSKNKKKAKRARFAKELESFRK